MSDDALRELAEAAALSTRWIDYRGVHHEVDPGILRALLRALEIPCDSAEQVDASRALIAAEKLEGRLPPMIVARVGQPIALGAIAAARYRIEFETGGDREGFVATGADGLAFLPPVAAPGYHRVEIGDRSFTLAATPERCFGVHDIGGERKHWGLCAQIYSLRRSGDGGIGDFSGLAQFLRSAAAQGADALAVSPVHALFSADVERFSPYSPSSRLFVNALHADPAEVFGEAAVKAAITVAGLGDARTALEALPLIDWPAAARIKLDLARSLYAGLSKLSAKLRKDFKRFCDDGGAALRDHARFEALQAHFLSGAAPRWSWREWPEAFRRPSSAEVESFAREHADEIRFHSFLQWLADRGLRSVQTAAHETGMAIGLIGDLAVGTDGGGSHAWSRQHDLLIGVSVGAPPDALNGLGQSWGLTAFSPRTLRQHGYGPFLEMLRAQLRNVGGLRIDHVLGLGRLWLVPDGASATEGAYLRYPIEDLFGLIALESWRHRAVIIGEDMGTVPDGFRIRMDGAGILGMRVLWFERDWGLFVEPERWPGAVVSLTTTHDLPTVAGWWQGRDIDWRAKLALYGAGEDEAGDRAARAEDRARLWAAFGHAGVAQGEPPDAGDTTAVVDAAAAFVARTPSPLVLLPAEDALGLSEQPNVPGTIDAHPNWRRRLPGVAATMLDTREVRARLGRLAAGRRTP